LKKRTKKLLFIQHRGCVDRYEDEVKSFLLLFFKKEGLTFYSS